MPDAAATFVPPPLTPGAYLKYRRQAALLSIEDVALAVSTRPRIAQHVRADWLRLIEADAAPASWPTISALRGVFEFDLDVLDRLERIRQGIVLDAPRLCRICACSACDPCIVPPTHTCRWVEPNLCSACAPAAAHAA